MCKRHASIPIFLLFISFAAAELADPPAQKLGLPGLVARALESNPELEWNRQTLEAFQSTRSEASWWNPPEVRFGYGRDTVVSDPFRSRTHPDNQYEASIRLSPKNPLERRALNDLQTLQIQQQQLVGKETRTGVLQTVHQLYWEACGLDAELKMRKEIKTLYDKKSEGLQLLLDQGQVSLAQSLPNQIKQIELSIDIEALAAQRDEAVEQLAALCGVEPSAILLQSPAQLNESSFALPFDQWKQLASESRTDLGKYTLQIEQAKLARELVKADRMLWIDHVQTSYEVSNAPGDSDRASLQLALRLPFLVSDQGEEIRAVKNVQAYRAQSELKRQLVDREVEALIRAFRSLHRRWQMQAASIHAFDQELVAAISNMETQETTLEAATLEARIARLQLKLKSLQIQADYQQLRLKAGIILQIEDALPQPVN